MRLKDEARLLDEDSRQRETHSLLLEMGYSFTDAFSLDIFSAVIRQERTIFSGASSDDFVFTQGIGDLVILPKYTFKNRWTLGVGLKLPTGKSNNSNDGITLSAEQGHRYFYHRVSPGGQDYYFCNLFSLSR